MEQTILSPIEQTVLRGEIEEALRTIYDPEIPVNIYDLGLIYAIDVAQGRVRRHSHDADLARLPCRRHAAARSGRESGQCSRRVRGACRDSLGSHLEHGYDVRRSEVGLRLVLETIPTDAASGVPTTLALFRQVFSIPDLSVLIRRRK